MTQCACPAVWRLHKVTAAAWTKEPVASGACGHSDPLREVFERDYHGGGGRARRERLPRQQQGVGPAAAAPAVRFKRDSQHGAGLREDLTVPPVGE